jgi:hypothetical protein
LGARDPLGRSRGRFFLLTENPRELKAMSDDRKQLETIKSQTLALIAQITAEPKPSYSVDGQQVGWNDYLTRLRQTVDWCDARLTTYDAVETQTQAFS